MSKREIASLVCKVLALWLLVQGVLSMASILLTIMKTIESISMGSDWGYALGGPCAIGFVGAAFLVLGWIVWAKADSLAVRMVGDDETPVTGTNISKEGWITIAVVALGLFLFVSGVCDLVRSVAYGFMRSRAIQGSLYDSLINDIHSIAAVIVQIVLAVWMMVGSKGIIRLICKFRTMGHKEQIEKD